MPRAPRASMQAHWYKLRQIGAILGVPAASVNLVHARLKSENLVDGILSREPEAVRMAHAILKSRQSPEKHDRIVAADASDLEKRASSLNIMLWAIRKIGSVESATDAFDRAICALTPEDDGCS